MLLNDLSPLYSLEDISIIPAEKTDIISRSECNPYRENIERTGLQRLPVITAPMSCVLNAENYQQFIQNRVNAVIPRTVPFEDRLELSKTIMTAFSMQEAKDILVMPEKELRKWCILIDMANGHMNAEIQLGKQLRERYKDRLILMGGNIANPNTYLDYALAGFDYVRVGIGGGNGCLTSTQTAIHYPMASLISDIIEVKNNSIATYERFGNEGAIKNILSCMIVADGGISRYSDIIKCLALGADYVMMGRVFSQAALEGEEVGQTIEYYGMSTKKAQTELGSDNNHLKTSEGKFLTLKKEYTLPGWVDNMVSYLRSSMSYTDSRTLDEFPLKANCRRISSSASRKINDK